MFKRHLTPTDYFLIAVNLVPVYGVWFLDWSGKEVFIVYAMETLIVGIFTVVKLGIATLYKKRDLWYNREKTSQVPGLFFILFFIVHYGLFACVQTSIFADSANINPAGAGMLYFFFNWYKYVQGDIAIMLAIFVIGYLVRDMIPFLSRKEYQSSSMMRLMFQPYGRIFVQQFIVILGSLFLSAGFDKIFILIFAAVKTWVEVFIRFDRYLNVVMMKLERKSGEQ